MTWPCHRLDGLTVCRQIRAEPGLTEVAVIILSGSDSAAAITGGFAEGATDYMTKPFAPAMIRTRVRAGRCAAALGGIRAELGSPGDLRRP